MTNEKAIAAGWPNHATYLYAQRRQAQQRAIRDAARVQAKYMALRRQQQQAGGGGGGSDLHVIPSEYK